MAFAERRPQRSLERRVSRKQWFFKHFATKDELYGGDPPIRKDARANTVSWMENPEVQKAMDERDDFGFFYHLALRAMNKTSFGCRVHCVFCSFRRWKNTSWPTVFFKEFVAKIYEFIGAYIEKRQQEGSHTRDINPRIAVKAFIGMDEYITRSIYFVGQGADAAEYFKRE
jgi:hypothetical protein